jgi:hypothetical protein
VSWVDSSANEAYGAFKAAGSVLVLQ